LPAEASAVSSLLAKISVRSAPAVQLPATGALICVLNGFCALSQALEPPFRIAMRSSP